MYVLKSTDELKIKGIPYHGFPLLTWSSNNEALGIRGGDLFFEGFKFLLYYGVKRGRTRSDLSVNTYANQLCHYFSFCEVNNIDWRNICETPENEMILAVYRDVSIEHFKLSSNTVNQRLRLIIKFYKYSKCRGWVVALPYGLEEVSSFRDAHGFMAHIARSGNKQMSYDVLLKNTPSMIKFYSIDEVKTIIDSIHHSTLKLMVRMIFQTGIRKKELLRFPLEAIQKPQVNKNLYRVKITFTKGFKPREIDIPAKLMRDLYEYKIELRHQQAMLSGVDSNYLFLTSEGKEWSLSANGFNSALDRLKLPIRVIPHRCRHTYATHILVALQRNKNTRFEPLIYIRDRLGHACISTTMVYLHLVNELVDDLTIDYQNEIDSIV